MRLGTLPGADYSQQEQKCPLPSASLGVPGVPAPKTPQFLALLPTEVELPGLDTACRAGVC